MTHTGQEALRESYNKEEKAMTVVQDGDSLDDLTKSINIVDYPHHEIHDGLSFLVTDVQNVDTTTIKWQITVPESTYLHSILDIEGTGEILITITEGSDRTNGVALPNINRNRSSVNTSSVVVSRTPSSGTTDGATTIMSKRSGNTSAGGNSSTPGGERGDNEFVLNANTKYVISVTTYANIYVSIGINWYEK